MRCLSAVKTGGYILPLLLFWAPGLLYGAAQPPNLQWVTLLGNDPITGKANAEVLKLDGQRVRIPGFMVPLEYSFKSIAEFLLVPVVPGCIHVPPPPPHQTIMVKMKNKTAMVWEPVWVVGLLKVIQKKKSEFGDASYEMIGESVEMVKEKNIEKLGLRGMDPMDMGIPTPPSAIPGPSSKSKELNNQP